MRSFISTFVAGLSALSAVSAVPIFTADGFPNPSPAQLTAIEQTAQGTLPNGPPPPGLSPEGVTNLQLVATNEVLEQAYFGQLLNNITNRVPGYTFNTQEEYDFAHKTIAAVLAQEELHALNAITALTHFNHTVPQPCQYMFPVTNFQDAIVLAATFTDVVLGTLQDVIQIFAQNGDFGLARGVASIIGQEGEQNGWYRLLQGKIPSALPFLTTSSRDFAFTAIQNFIVPGSCDLSFIPLKTFGGLTILTPPTRTTSTIKLQWNKNLALAPAGTTLHTVYINQQNTPIVVDLTIESVNGNVVIGESVFPYDANELNSLTIVALTTSAGPFVNADAVAAATAFGPGLIEL